ncbi:phosphatidylserine decarboxylase [Nanoarchaeota archaeon]
MEIWQYMIITIVSIILILLMMYRFIFLRDPVRISPPGPVIVSPADGRIVKIVKIGDKNPVRIKKGLMGKIEVLSKDVFKKGYLISIMMNIHNVHYQRAPLEGIVQTIKYTPGAFRNAVKDASSMQAIDNERNEIIIKNNKIGKIKVIQIAGLLARRIKCFAEENKFVKKGQKIGLITLGSQVSILLPDKVKLLCEEEEKVKAGETIIAKY